MEYCGYKIIENIDVNGEIVETGSIVNSIVPELDNIKVKINPNPANKSEYYIILK